MIYLMMIDGEEEKRKFVILYEKYRCLMLKVACNILQDNFLAEDAVHDAFMKIAGNIGNSQGSAGKIQRCISSEICKRNG